MGQNVDLIFTSLNLTYPIDLSIFTMMKKTKVSTLGPIANFHDAIYKEGGETKPGL